MSDTPEVECIGPVPPLYEYGALEVHADSDGQLSFWTCDASGGPGLATLPRAEVVKLRDALDQWLDDAPVVRPYVDKLDHSMEEAYGRYYDCSACDDAKVIREGTSYCPSCGAFVDWTNKP